MAYLTGSNFLLTIIPSRMKKKFVIIRHAKAAFPGIGEADFDRNLANSGKKDALAMGQYLLSLQLKPEAVYHSAAKRTTQTAQHLIKYCEQAPQLIAVDKLYNAPESVIEDIIASADDKFNTIYIVAHNPGLSNFVWEYSAKQIFQDLPTCAIAAFELNSNSWAEFYTASKKLINFDYPKNLD
jgi:phosphohistidine phosphatase